MNEINFSELHLLDEFEENLDVLTPEQRCFFNSATSESKSAVWYPTEYEDNAKFLISAESPSARRFCLCGAASEFNRSGVCQLKKFCCRCAGLQRSKQWGVFRHRFHGKDWNFLTFSYSGGFPLDQPGSTAAIEHHWNAPSHALKKVAMDFGINGYIFVEELSVSSLLPCVVLPHAHALVNGDVLTDEHRDSMALEITDYLRQHLVEEEIRPPHLKFDPVQDESHFENAFKYLFKPIQGLGDKYRQAYDSTEGDLSRIRALNSQVKDFVLFTGSFYGRKALKKGGNMHATCRSYIGEKLRPMRRRSGSNRNGAQLNIRDIVVE